MSSVIVNKTQSFFFSSDPLTGASNISPDGSVFTIYLDTPISLPKACVNATIEVVQSQIWNTSYNISAEFANNNFTFTSATIPHSLTIPDGLYSLSGLNAFLGTQFVNLGLSSGVITFSGDDSTQKSVLTFANSADSVNFTTANSVRDILGFNSQVIVSPSAGFSVYSDNSANFNRVNSYLIKSNLISNGLMLNNVGVGLIASVPIDASPGSQINYAPSNPVQIDCSELIGQSKGVLQFSLLDQSLRPAPTVGELWSFILVFKWSILLTNEKLPLTSF
jgi:hypothetical protein